MVPVSTHLELAFARHSLLARCVTNVLPATTETSVTRPFACLRARMVRALCLEAVTATRDTTALTATFVCFKFRDV